MAIKFLNDQLFPTDIFLVDVSAGRVGINTLLPRTALEVVGTLRVWSGANTHTYVETSSGSNLGSIQGKKNSDNDVRSLALNPLGGNVGINLGAGIIPSENLQVQGSAKIQADASNYVGISSNSTSTSFSTVGNGIIAPDIIFNINTTNRLTIDGTTGNVGIGTATPGAKLQVDGDGIFNGSVVINKNLETLRLGTTTTIGGTYQTWHNASGRKGFFGYGSDVNDTIYLVNEENSTIQLGTNSRTADFVVSANGNIGLGITSPGVKLVTITQNYSEGPTLGSGVVGGQALLATNGLFGQYSGVSSTTGHVWHQVQRNDATTAYNMILQPSGGGVGIGTTSPNAALSVHNTTSTLGSRVASFYHNNGTENPFIEINSLSDGMQLKAGFTTGVAGHFDILTGGGSSFITLSPGSSEKMRITSAGDAGIGVTTPRAKLDVNGGVKVADDTDGAALNKVGTLRYRYVPGSPKNYSYVDMCMQTGTNSYAWVNIVQNVW